MVERAKYPVPPEPGFEHPRPPRIGIFNKVVDRLFGISRQRPGEHPLPAEPQGPRDPWSPEPRLAGPGSEHPVPPEPGFEHPRPPVPHEHTEPPRPLHPRPGKHPLPPKPRP